MRRFMDFQLCLALGLLGFCGFLFFWAFPRYIPTRGGDGLEAMLPNGVVAFLAVLSAVYAVSRLRTVLSIAGAARAAPSDDDRRQRRRSAAFLIGSLVYAGLLPVFGYVLSSVLLISWFLFLMNERHPVVFLLVAVLPPFALNFLLARVLLVRFTALDNFFAGL